MINSGKQIRYLLRGLIFAPLLKLNPVFLTHAKLGRADSNSPNWRNFVRLTVSHFRCQFLFGIIAFEMKNNAPAVPITL